MYTFVSVSILILSFCLYFILTEHIFVHMLTHTPECTKILKRYWGRGAQDVHLDFHTAPELSVSVLLYVHRVCTYYWGRGAKLGHLDFHTAPGLFVSVSLYIHRDCTDYWGRGAQDVHLDFHAAPELFVSVLLYVHRDRRDC